MTPKNAALRAMCLTLMFDLGMAMLAMIAATVMVWKLNGARPPFPVQSLLLSASFATLAAAAAFMVRGIPKQVWRHLGRPDAYAIVQALGLWALFYMPIMLLLNGRLFAPWATLGIAGALFFVGVFTGRAIALERSTDSPLQFLQAVPQGRQRILLVGDAITCSNVLKRLQDTKDGRKLLVLGVLDVGNEHPGRSIRGVSVMGGLDKLREVLEIMIERYDAAPWIAVVGEGRSRDVMVRALEIASTHNSKVMALGSDAVSHKLQPVYPADLLARPERCLDPAPVRRLLEGARVLVTGGGGTIGAELTRQAAASKPSHLGVLDACELNLYTIDLGLSEIAPGVARSVHLGDVRDPLRLSEAFADVRPQIVIHAAALKHVPLMETNLCEAILTNVAGAANVAAEAVNSGAERLVFISTDKAVDPDNVMGATKRLAEIVVSRFAEKSRLAVSIVRFGNVLGSSGSVVPLFERQIDRGGPVTVTHPGATRYFMTLEEASSLVLQAAALQSAPGVSALFVLDMGEPIKIGQLAEAMIRLKGSVPGVDIMIETRGLRPGEKMHETLTYDDEALTPTGIDGINRGSPRNGMSELFDKRLAELFDAARARDHGEARRLLSVLVPEYQPGTLGKANRVAASG
jgi:FlaA1/EpsC-like NDP-sugar epimerase